MRTKAFHSSLEHLSRFNRQFFDATEKFTYIGSGELGGKAQGLAFAAQVLSRDFPQSEFPDIQVTVPTLTVIATEVFHEFMQLNRLYDLAVSEMRDDQIAHAFQKADLPAELVGDLMALIAKVHSPLAVRSSSLLEDAMYEPFAGVYETKMIPNNQLDTDTRFRRLVEAIKFVYASTYFKSARDYIKMTGESSEHERMAVIIQEVVGLRHADRFYPNISGVARSYNYYPMGPAKPEQGVVSLALGLGKTIVDGGRVWSYSPAHPNANPPYKSLGDLLKLTQTEFWCVNMGKPPEHDPIRETEYLLLSSLSDSEHDDTLRFVASTYHPHEERITIGIGRPGPRLVDFAPILKINDIPLNGLVRRLLDVFDKAVGGPVELEFAVTLNPEPGLAARFGFLQVRPMVVSQANVEVAADDLSGADVIAASERVMGNGMLETICDIVYVKPDAFEARHTPAIASELDGINRPLVDEGRPYMLIGFGRWGSSDPWLGIPVDWSRISGAKVIVEATLPEMNVELSQGSHFFHNLSSFQIFYFSVSHSGKYHIDWKWLDSREVITDTGLVRHVRLAAPLRVKVDGRSGRGVITK
jgi:hypothetical protein